MSIRTNTTKQAEILAFEKLPSWSIIIGATKELWKRHSIVFWIAGFWIEFAIIIWIKLG